MKVMMRVVVIGGGFAGFSLARRLRTHAHVTVVSEEPLLCYTPFLPQVAGGLLEPRHVMVSLRDELPHADVVIGTALALDHSTRTVTVATLAGERTIEYDHVVVAPGSVTRVLPVPGIERAIGFKTLAEAVWLRNHILGQMEQAMADPDRAEQELSVVVAGGGYAGVEALLEVADLMRRAARTRYPQLAAVPPRLTLVEATEHLLPGLSAASSAYTAEILADRGVTVHTGRTIATAQGDQVCLDDGTVVPARTLIWTTGVIAHPCCRWLGLPLTERGQILVDDDLSITGWEHAWALGDAAAVPDPARSGMFCPPSAQHALRQAICVAHNIRAVDAGRSTHAFRYRTRGVFADLGRRRGVGMLGSLPLHGWPAWLMVRAYHFTRIPGLRRRLRIAVAWMTNTLLGRDLTPLSLITPPTLPAPPAPREHDDPIDDVATDSAAA